MNLDTYLQRIDYHGSHSRTAETLRALQRAHILAVPFENLDIYLGQHIGLDEAAFYEKIVRRRRGGFCYELNGLFATLLRALGFEVTLLSARVMDSGQPGPEFDHLVLLVQLEEHWLVDVGFGDSFIEPLKLDDSNEQLLDDVAYRLSNSGEQWTMQRRSPDHEWETQYQFTLLPRQLADFTGMCHYHQTSPQSNFTQKRICSRATPTGRVTLSEMRLIVTANDERRERTLADHEAYKAALREYFGIDLSLC